MGESAIEVRDAVVAHVRATHPDLCRHWFDEIGAVGIDAAMLWLLVTEPVRRKYLQRSCGEAFREAAQVATGRLITVTFVGEDEARDLKSKRRDKQVAALNGRASTMRTSAFDEMTISPDYTFENFVEGPDNRFAYSAALAVSKSPGQSYNPFFIHGGVGLGKTHLLQAICQAIMMRWPEINIYYISCETFTSQFMDAVGAGDMMGFRTKYRSFDVLVIDDIHELSNRNRTQEEFFHTFNTLYQAGKQIVLSSDAPPHEIPDLEERLVSRFSQGLVTPIDRPCFDTRVAILKKKAAMRELDLPDDVAAYIAGIVDSNIRDLEGAITKLQIHSSVDHEPVSLDLARKALGRQIPDDAVHQPTIQLITDVVCDYYNVKLVEVLSRRKTKSIAFPRQVAMWLARRLTRFSLEEIGLFYGGRDHTTVIHAVDRIEELRDSDAQVSRDVSHLERTLQNNE